MKYSYYRKWRFSTERILIDIETLKRELSIFFDNEEKLVKKMEKGAVVCAPNAVYFAQKGKKK